MRLRPILALLLLTLGARALAQGVGVGGPSNRFPNVRITKRDWKGNVPASDSSFYYLNADGTSKPDGGGTQPDVEYDQDAAAHASGVVYVRGGTATVSLTFSNSLGDDLTGTIRFTGAKLVAPDATGTGTQDIALTVSPSSSTPITIPGHDAAGHDGTMTVTVTLSGLPNSVALGDVKVAYDLPLYDAATDTSGNNGTGNGTETWERMYIVDAAPVGLQAVPWTDFLELTCRWAFGAAGQTDMRQKMTYGMHYGWRSPSHVLYYQAGDSFKYTKFIYDTWKSPNPSLKLNRFIEDLSNSANVFMQCADWAAILNTAFSSQGYATSSTAYYATASDGSGGTQDILFQTNALCSPQYDDTDGNSYTKSSFRFHVIVSDNDLRFDASNSYYHNYLDGSNYFKPVVAWTYPKYFWVEGSSHYGLVCKFNTDYPDTKTIIPIDHTPSSILKG